ncbi:MAG: hypothetical protein WD316_10450 [Phycisphaeraceae bacterium]
MFDHDPHSAGDLGGPHGVGPAASDAPRRAAIATWIVAGVELLLFGCCTTVFMAVAAVPAELLREQLAERDLPPEQVDAFVQGQAGLMVYALAILVTMVLPALVLLVLAFRIGGTRGGGGGGGGATRGAHAILLVQAVILGALVLMSLVVGVAQRDLAGLAMSVVVFGGMLALIVWALGRLREARDAITRVRAYDDQPWNV